MTLAIFISLIKVQGQQKVPSPLGVIKGAVRDSVNNYFLKSATASVYRSDNSNILSYQITNSFGEFSFNNLPANIPLRLEITHVGYQSIKREFIIPAATNHFDLKILVIQPANVSLKEVIVSVPPITMNGDTLEFNASAFKLDTNAVVEDLLKKIPNITLWGDGVITVNGREIKKLLVNGKEFFGTNFKIATQNIPKNAIDKIQVYNSVVNDNNPLDSILNMNIKLKKGKELGYFGKVGMGYGTNTRYEIDASMNFFNSKTQLALVGARNNINKISNNINTLLENSTFKGVGTNIDYQPNFALPGNIKSDLVGASYSHNFIEKPTYDNKKFIKLSYFLQNKTEENLSNFTKTSTIDELNKVVDKSINNRISSNTNHNFDSRLEWLQKKYTIVINQSFKQVNGENFIEDLSEIFNNQNLLTGTYSKKSKSDIRNNSFNLSANFLLRESRNKKQKLFRGFNATYLLTINEVKNDQLNITNFESLISSGEKKEFNRTYQTDVKNTIQNLKLELKDLKSIFLKESSLAGMIISFSNDLKFITRNAYEIIEDFDGINLYKENFNLTNKLQLNQLEETPALSLIKTFNQSLSNRYSKSFNFNTKIKHQFLFQDHQSDKSFQNIKRQYASFIPELTIEIRNNQFGEYLRNYIFKYETTIQIPTLSQLAPLMDSVNIFNLFKGNPNLKKAVSQHFEFNFSHGDQTKKRNLNYGLKISLDHIKDNIVDSIFIHADNRREIYFVNANGGYLFTSLINIRKPIKYKTSTLQFNFSSSFSLEQKPNYLNGVFNFSKISQINSSLTLNYLLKDFLVLEANQSFTHYNVNQNAFHTKYSGMSRQSTLSSQYILTKSFSLGSNITLSGNRFSNNRNIHYTIWNANLTYRFLKGKNAELKVSALDLLRQNNSVINFGDFNTTTIGTRNVLQNFFLTTFSYYPRQFGKKNVKK